MSSGHNFTFCDLQSAYHVLFVAVAECVECVNYFTWCRKLLGKSKVHKIIKAHCLK